METLTCVKASITPLRDFEAVYKKAVPPTHLLKDKKMLWISGVLCAIAVLDDIPISAFYEIEIANQEVQNPIFFDLVSNVSGWGHHSHMLICCHLCTISHSISANFQENSHGPLSVRQSLQPLTSLGPLLSHSCQRFSYYRVDKCVSIAIGKLVMLVWSHEECLSQLAFCLFLCTLPKSQH